MWNFFKYVGAASVLMMMAISRQSAIQGIYNTATGAAAYAAAMANPGTYYEFGLCSFTWTPGLAWLNNLMTEQGAFSDFGSTSSSVALYLWYAGLVFALIAMIGAVMLVVAFNASNNRMETLDFGTMMMNLTFVVLLMAIANEIFQLYELHGLYVSAWNLSYMVASHVMTMLFFVVFLIYWMVEAFTETSDFCKIGVLVLMCTLFGIFTIFSVVLSIVNYQTSGENIHVIVNSLLFLSLLEIPYCLCTPGLRKVFNAVHDFTPITQEEAAAAREAQLRRDQERQQRDIEGAAAAFE